MTELRTRPLTAWTLSTLSPCSVCPGAVLQRVSGAISLQLLPLIRRQLAAYLQQEPRIRLLQLGPGLGHLVDLCQNLRLVRRILAHQRLQFQLGLLQAPPQIHQRLPMRKKR